MAGKDQEPFDLISFFGLSEEEARGLGLDASSKEVPQRTDAKAPPLDLHIEAVSQPPASPPFPATPPGDPVQPHKRVLDDTGQFMSFAVEHQPLESNGLFLVPPLDARPASAADVRDPRGDDDSLPERAEILPWPSEAEMLAAGPAPDPEFDVPTPPGVRSWVSVPVTPVRDPLEDQSAEIVWPVQDVQESWPPAQIQMQRDSSGAPPMAEMLPSATGPQAEFPSAFSEEPTFSPQGRGPYGLTEEQLADLGPDILRDLDLAMAEQPATMPLRMVPDAPEGTVPAASLPMPAIGSDSRTPLPPDMNPDHVVPPDWRDTAIPPDASMPPDVVPVPSVSEPTPVPPPSQSFAGLAGQLLDVFMDEAIEMLDSLHSCLELLERGPSDSAVIEARRTVHTIKGGARMCGLKAITALAHSCEDAIGHPSAGQDTLHPSLITLLFQAEQEMRAALAKPTTGPGSDESLSAMSARLQEVREHTPPAGGLQVSAPDATAGMDAAVGAPEDVEDVVATAPPSAPAEPAPALQPPPARLNDRSQLLRRPAITSVSPQGNRLAVDLNKVEGMVAKVTEIVANRAASHGLVESLSGTVGEVMHTVHRLQSITVALQYQIASHGLDLTPEQDPDGLALETYGPIRQLMLQLAEAVSDQQALVQATMDVVTNKRALAAIETRLDTDLQGALLNMRLLPLSQLRVRLDQVVRSASAAAGREVRWMMEGQNVALDKHVCDRLFEPLMHLLRNAIDHGIEPPQERETKGKPRNGRIVVQAAVEGNQAVVSVSDDGRGMDPERIAAVAVERGVIGAEQARLLSPREKIELVFRAGFSTATTVTELSGRGMGMEIVREACIRMGGTASISPRVGGGTTITLQVPLSMSVVRALIVRDAGRLMAIPASQVLSVHLVRTRALGTREHGQVVRIGHEEMPLYHLPAGVTRPGTKTKDAEELSVLVVPYRAERVALVVDEMVNEDDLIVKPLPLLLQGVDRLLGAVVLPDGVPAPVLNLPPLLDQILFQEDMPPAPSLPPAAEQMVLVVDDSLTMRVALTQSLEHAGFTVLTARDGQEALEVIRLHGLPQLVTLDIEMPRMDGLDTLYAIRQMAGGAELPIFMLTSRSSQKHKRTAMKMGATQYFTKPYHDSEFIGAVQDAIGLQQFSPIG